MEKSYRIGALAVVFAVFLRIGCSNLPQKAVDTLAEPKTARLLLFAGTGQWLSLPSEGSTHQAESAVPAPAAQAFSFSEDDAQLVHIQNMTDRKVDIPALLQTPLEWSLHGDAPGVLILHTHTSESYTYTGGYIEETSFRTLDQDHNMLVVGQTLAAKLEQRGISAIQDRSFHDHPSYNGSYLSARGSLSDYLESYPSIRLVLDLHRDAIEDLQGNQLAQTCSVNGQEAARIMLVIGTNHDYWQENLALAVKLQARLEQLYPGLCRPIVLRSQRYNQDLSAGALLVEIGTAGNTLQQALYSADLLSHAIADLQQGSRTERTDNCTYTSGNP